MTEKIKRPELTVPAAYSRGVRFVNAFARLRGGPIIVTGQENLPTDDKPFIVAANHSSFLDAPLVATALHNQLGRQVRFLANEELWERHVLVGDEVIDQWPLNYLLGWMMDRCGAIPITRNQRLSKKVMQELDDAVDNNEIIGIFPEGGLRHDEQLDKVHLGAGMLAARYGIKVVPVGIDGADPLKNDDGVRDFGRFHIHIGQPIEVPKSTQTVKTSRTVTPLLAAGMQDAVDIAREERDRATTLERLLTF